MLTISAKESGRIQPIEPGTYPAVAYGLIDLGEQFSDAYQKWSRKVMIMWEIPSETFDNGTGDMVSRVISQKYTASLNERSALRRDLIAWRGRDFTDEELKAFDLRTIIGKPCLLNIVHREYNGQTYANIGGVMKLPKGMKTEPPTLDHIIFDLDTDDLAVIETLPEWIEKQIKESRQYKERTGAAPAAADKMNDFEDEVEDEDDVPF